MKLDLATTIGVIFSQSIVVVFVGEEGGRNWARRVTWRACCRAINGIGWVNVRISRVKLSASVHCELMGWGEHSFLLAPWLSPRAAHNSHSCSRMNPGRMSPKESTPLPCSPRYCVTRFWYLPGFLPLLGLTWTWQLSQESCVPVFSLTLRVVWSYLARSPADSAERTSTQGSPHNFRDILSSRSQRFAPRSPFNGPFSLQLEPLNFEASS